uniref:Capsid protein n=1 Tax=Schizosaccharomyces japonicus TaxID=4897 RepID=A0A0M3T9E0_SCHJP|nr:capsid protein [Schizosaccharomyces japonicus]
MESASAGAPLTREDVLAIVAQLLKGQNSEAQQSATENSSAQQKIETRGSSIVLPDSLIQIEEGLIYEEGMDPGVYLQKVSDYFRRHYSDASNKVKLKKLSQFLPDKFIRRIEGKEEQFNTWEEAAFAALQPEINQKKRNMLREIGRLRDENSFIAFSREFIKYCRMPRTTMWDAVVAGLLAGVDRRTRQFYLKEHLEESNLSEIDSIIGFLEDFEQREGRKHAVPHPTHHYQRRREYKPFNAYRPKRFTMDERDNRYQKTFRPHKFQHRHPFNNKFNQTHRNTTKYDNQRPQE